MNFMQNPDHPITLLAFGTLIGVLILAAIALARFLRNRRHRHPMRGQRERNIEEIRTEGGTTGIDGVTERPNDRSSV